MFEMKQIGLRLVEMRKKFDLTQVEVADHLGVSYQAVSNWERGESMPDISKLPEIAALYKTTLDDLFGNKRFTRVIESASKDELKELVKDDPLGLKEVSEISAIVKPSQLEELAETAIVEDVEPNMLDLLPFVNKKKAKKIVLDLLNEMDAYILLGHAVAFVDKDTNDIIYKEAEKGNFKPVDFLDFAPFLHTKTLDKIVEDALEDGTNLEGLLEKVAPFVSKKTMNKIMEQVIGIVPGEKLIEFAPFISKEIMNNIVKEMLDNEKDFSTLFDHVVPFISQEIADQIVLKDLELGREVKKYIHSAPFLSKEVLDKIIESL